MAEQSAKASAKAAAAPSGGNDDVKVIGAIGYIILIVVPLFVLLTDKKNNKELLFHAWQSLLLTVALFIIGSGLSMVTLVAPPLACIFLPISFAPLLYLLFIAYKTYTGVKYMVPMLGEQAQKMAMK